MSDAGKKGAVGIVAVLGLGFARYADDCGRAAKTGARLADDVVVDGSRLGGRVAAEAPGLGGVAKWGPESAAMGRAGAEVVTADADDVAKTIIEGSVDVAMDVVPLVGDGQPALPLPEQRIACPTVVDLAAKPGAWSEFLDGFGTKCAPSIFVGHAPAPRLLAVGSRTFEVSEMARACAEIPATCMFIGCDPADETCTEQATTVQRGVPLHQTLDGYIAALARKQVDAGAYAFVAATVGGELMLLEPQG